MSSGRDRYAPPCSPFGAPRSHVRPGTGTVLRALVVGLGLTMGPATVAAEEETAAVVIDEQQALERAARHSPSLGAALADWQVARQNVLAEQNRYWPTLGLDVGVTRTASPGMSGSDGVTTGTSDSLVVGSELSHVFSWGTSVSFRLESDTSRSEMEGYGTSGQLVARGPGYGLSGRLTIAQPLMRGFGDDVGEAALRQARLRQTAAERARDQAASVLLRDVLVAYWELWYASRAVGIERAALGLAVRRRDDTRAQVDQGALAPVELLPLETRVAEREQAALLAETQRRQQSVSLATLLGDDRPAGDGLRATASEPPQAAPVPDRGQTIERAIASSQALAELRAELAVAEDQATVAGDGERPRLDLEAYLQSEGLGNRQVPPAFEQFARFGAVSAHLGLSFEAPLSGARRSALQRSAQANVEGCRERLRAKRLQIEAAVIGQLVTAETARQRAELARRTAEVAARQVAATQERHAQGDAILLEVHDAEDAERRAVLAVERARVDGKQADVALAHLTGALLGRHGRLVPGAPARAAGGWSGALLAPGPF